VAGRPVLVLPRTGIDFAIAFFGCLYAGAIAVPCSSGPRKRGWERIAAIAADCKPAAAIGSGEVSDLFDELAALGIAVIDVDAGAPDGLLPPQDISADAPALLQYTSGSTGSPKGVVVTHQNLASNLGMLETSFGVREDSVYLTWLPLFHDMGLIGNLLAALYCGVPCVLMPPFSFYQRPQRWLNAIGRFGATISGGPNFAYELLLRRSDRMNLAGLDLSRWELAFCGAEMVRASTMRGFAGRFAPSGFRASALYPCYGLAEATVFVTGATLNGGARMATDALGRDVVSCGRAAAGECVVIVDADTAALLPDGQVGEIWVSGGHVACGYWNKPELSEQVFAGRISSGGDDRFLRTGDLGWMSEGELFFAGRLTDTIVFRGTNFYPEDIEATAAGCHSGLANFGAAFPIDAGNEEQAVLVQELARPLPASFDPRAAIAAIATAVVNAHGLPLHDIVLVRAGALPRTTSGKIRRKDCRAIYAEKGFAEASQESLRRLYHARDAGERQRAT
jgi:acyl-CoA synthetase (AMP-forming)/AMP-acid ligase II